MVVHACCHKQDHWYMALCAINYTVLCSSCCLLALQLQSSIDSQLFVDNRNFCLPHLHSTPPPLGGSLSQYFHDVWYGKSRMVWLPDGEKSLKICLFISTEFTNVTDRQTDTAWRHRSRLHSIMRQKSKKISRTSFFSVTKQRYLLMAVAGR